MKWRGIVILTFLLVLFIVSPFTLVSIQGNSMEPTIPDDSLLVNYETKNVGDGDIITFYDGVNNQYITHRIVNESSDGYITIGDNNERIDQDTSIRPVKASAIQGKALTIGDQPLYIPYLGSIFTILQQNLIQIILLLFGAYFGLTQASKRTEQQRVFGHLVARDIFRPFFIIAIVLLVVVFTITAITLATPIVYTDSPSAANQQYLVQTGDTPQTETITVERKTTWYLGNLYFSDTLEIANVERTAPTRVELDVVVPPQAEPGTLQSTVTLYQYPRVLPEPIVQELALINPILASFITSLITLAPVFLLYYAIIGPDTPIKSVRIEKWLDSVE